MPCSRRLGPLHRQLDFLDVAVKRLQDWHSFREAIGRLVLVEPLN